MATLLADEMLGELLATGQYEVASYVLNGGNCLDGVLQDFLANSQVQIAQYGNKFGRCAGCGIAASAVVGGKLKGCSRCECTFYCGPKCQKSDWKRAHKEMCERLAGQPTSCKIITDASSKPPKIVESRELSILVSTIDGKLCSLNFREVEESDTQFFVEERVGGDAVMPPRLKSVFQVVSAAAQRIYLRSFDGMPICPMIWRPLDFQVTRTFFEAAKLIVPPEGNLKEVSRALLNHLKPLMTMFFAHADRIELRKAQTAGREHERGVLVVESAGNTLEDLMDNANEKRVITVHYFKEGQLREYLRDVVQEHGEGLKNIRSLAKSAEKMVPNGKIKVLTQLMHSYGGIGVDVDSRKRVCYVSPGEKSLAHGIMILPSNEAHEEAGANIMDKTLSSARLAAAQMLEIDLCNKTVIAIDMDKDNHMILTDLEVEGRKCCVYLR